MSKRQFDRALGDWPGFSKTWVVNPRITPALQRRILVDKKGQSASEPSDSGEFEMLTLHGSILLFLVVLYTSLH